MLNHKYGVFYTPDSLAEFVANLLSRFFDIKENNNSLILDPSCGMCSLLKAAENVFGKSNQYVGIDIDGEVLKNISTNFDIIHDDAILPKDLNGVSADYWLERFHSIDAIIANPPWSSEKIYSKKDLYNAGFVLATGQYDSYVLFFELAYKILKNDGVMAFIIPDSIFEAQNQRLRKFLTENTQIKVIARLGEKIFKDVNRATTIIVCKKTLPDKNSITECFRLTSDDRKEYLLNKVSLEKFYEEKVHYVKQTRFSKSRLYNFDIDTFEDEEALMRKISSMCINWEEEFSFARGVEISKSGNVVYCNHCHMAQGYSKKHFVDGKKSCIYCKRELFINKNTIDNIIINKKTTNSVGLFVGENIHRYKLQGKSYLKTNIKGINYKAHDIYSSKKILIRKTGLGIYASIDYDKNYTSQTVYIVKSIKNNIPLEYYLALINSRVVYYYYLKKYGEIEWKSHPYLTKQIIFSLPLKSFIGDDIDKKIIELSSKLVKCYDRSLDLELETFIMRKYGLNKNEQKQVYSEINLLPDLSSINNMKIRNSEFYV